MAERKFNFEDDGESFGNILKLNEIYYNCTECPSPIEILSINENESTIEFKCINSNHKIKMEIKEYINKMKAFNNKNINDEICNNHNKKYECYCSDCKKHLCKECLKSKEHIRHNKLNLIEFQQNENGLKEIQNIIKYYENQIENLEREKLIKTKELNNKLKEAKEKLKNELNNITKEKNENINNKYKKEIDNLDNGYIKEIQKLDFNKKIENMKYLKRLNELIYNTYNIYNNNYFNSINVNILLIKKEKNKNEINKNDNMIEKNKYVKNKTENKVIKNMNLNKENKILDEKAKIIKTLEIEKSELKKNYDNLVSEKQILEKNYFNKEENEKNLYQKLNDVELKNEKLKLENKELNLKISELTMAINRNIGQIKHLEDFYDIIVNIKSIKDIAKGWEIKMTPRGEENFERYKKVELLKIGVIGNYNKGKTFLLSRLSKIPLPFGTSTEGLSIKYPVLKEFKSRKIILLDSAGTEKPVLKRNDDENMINKSVNNKEEEKKVNNIDNDNKNTNKKRNDDKSNRLFFKEKSWEKFMTELFLQYHIINNSDILILVVGILSFSEQKLLNRIKIEIQKSKMNRRLFIIHNLKTFLEIRQVEDYIENTLEKSANFELKKGHILSLYIKSSNGIYFFEKNSNPKIFHLIFASEGSEAGNYYIIILLFNLLKIIILL